MPTPTLKAVRKPQAERRTEIARAVLRIIGERGLTSLTTAAVAQEIGVTGGALFRHFASRDEMLQEAVTYALAKIEATFPDDALPPFARLMALARNRVHALQPDPGLRWLLRSEQAYLTLPEEAVQRLRALVDRSRRFLLDAIREGAAQGSVRADVDPEVLVVVVMGTIHALSGSPGIQKASSRRRPDPDRTLDGLELLLAPPAATAGASRRESKQK